ncbi:PAS domain-containing hybrid sensor histidine kinase/response regulator [Alteromonas flava]|uniref:PAS domain-containing hybrid sensor histidine kinase/response regulator n=1 Tax=Alteromonas flava TaxID=2048003 RepID=UPI000C28D168|nr:PAS-domain containing protein [Alteromonas flava]
MVFGWTTLAILYLFGLFLIARWGDKNSPTARWLTSHPAIYSLALAIYCTAWTFFGAVGQASRDNWMYLPILLGPVLVYALGYRFIYKLIVVSKKQHITTIADFIASRYGKRQAVALMVTVIALLATIPYIALQLQAIGTTFLLLTDYRDPDHIVLLATGFIAVFAIFFGTKNTDVTEYRRGLMLAIAFESSIKLLALVLIGFVAYFTLINTPDVHIIETLFAGQATATFSSFTFWAQTLMAAAAVICLPRQFHVAIIDNLSLSHLKTARWLFPLYLLIMAAVIPIIALAGTHMFANTNLAPDAYVLSIAMDNGSLILQALVFLGGLSAATAMIIVATLTLSTMLTNDIVLPRIFATNEPQQNLDYSRKIRFIRRIIIGLILLLSLAYHQQMAGSRSLSSIGLIAFSLVIQLLPPILGGLYWKRGHAHGVYAGLLVGLMCWVLWLVMPIVNNEFDQLHQNELLSQGAIISLMANAIAYILFSLWAPTRLIDRIQAEAFVSPTDVRSGVSRNQNSNVKVEDLLTLLTTFMGEGRCKQLVGEFNRSSPSPVQAHEQPSPEFVSFCERALGGVIGASSARVLTESVTRGKKLDFTEVINFFDDTTQAMQYNMTALITSLENIDQGISVVDKQLKLVAWNKRYSDMFDYPDGMLEVGTPVANLVRYNAEQGNCGPGDIEEEVDKRMQHLRAGQQHKFTRHRKDGKVIEMIGNPLPGGGFVTTFNDITGYVEIQQALEESNIDLEQRVRKRTEEVHSINAELRLEIQRRSDAEKELIRARQVAEEANASKTRFLALASHDVLQPLNAAKLYVSALQEHALEDNAKTLVSKLNQSVNASEHLIGTLLDIARLDQGDLKPSIEAVDIQQLLGPLLDQTSLKASEKGLTFRARIRPCWVMADKTYLYRIVQNLLSNAVKYTQNGKVLLTVRSFGKQVIVRVYDTGMGISEDQQLLIFSDFYRTTNHSESGVGLGLSVVRRLSAQMNCNVNVHSTLHQGSVFELRLEQTVGKTIDTPRKTAANASFSDLRVLCVDDQQENLDALKVLLERWGVHVETANNSVSAIEVTREFNPQIVLMDYQLSSEEDGLTLIETLRHESNTVFPACLITAVREQALIDECKAHGVHYMNKPVKPAKLRALLQSMTRYIEEAGVVEKAATNTKTQES